MKRPTIRNPTDLVLVGGGHTHIQVLKSFAMDPPRNLRTTVIVDSPVAVYSGMVPGFVAGQYERHEIEIDVLPLARLAGARIAFVAAIGLDPDEQKIHLEGRPPIPYDVASFDIGSTVAGLETPGVVDYALPTRPIGRFVALVDQRLEELATRAQDPVRVVVVGGGAGGVELAFTLNETIRQIGRNPEVTLIESAPTILHGYSPDLIQRVAEVTKKKGIGLVEGRVSSVDSVVALAEGREWPYDLLVWVAGAAGHPLFRDSDLHVDTRGFVQTRSTLQLADYDNVFAVGDCATLLDHPWVPKAGVYAVRQGPVLTQNLRKAVSGGTLLDSYRPQRDFLTLLNLGDGKAVGTKWGRSFSGRWVFRLKDRIDRRFMHRFQALGSNDARVSDSDVSPEFSRLLSMRENMDILCGGCAAKLGQTTLDRALARLPQSETVESGEIELGIAEGDDAAAYRTPEGSRIVSSVDQFRALTDDPFLVGKLGATNAASDIFAKGVSPSVAQALIALPENAAETEREEILFQVLAGARQALEEIGVTLVGGHTTTASELLVGFQVEGFARENDRLLAIDRLEPDQTLILTKPLGTGVLFHADMKGRARGRWIEAAIDSMLRSNGEAAAIAQARGATAATDVTGFGLARHLAAVLRASDLAAELDVAALPALPGAVDLLRAGLRSTFHPENETDAKAMEIAPEARRHPKFPLLFDPQTSGGLIVGVPTVQGDRVLAELRDRGLSAAAIGRTVQPLGDSRLRILASS